MGHSRSNLAQERGAVSTIVVVLLAAGVLLGFAALSVDIGQTVLERRELQNGADAGALSLAQSCAEGNCVQGADGLEALVNKNAADNRHDVVLQCGTSDTPLDPCPLGSLTDITQCPPLPSSAAGVSYVEVHTQTLTTDGTSALNNFFGRGAGANETEAQVNACARAGWGPPGGAEVLPVTFSYCEYRDALNKVDYGVLPVDPLTPYKGETALTFKYKSTGPPTAPVTTDPCAPLGHVGIDAPGGFGWLNSTECVAYIDEGGWVAGEPGKAAPDECARAGDTILIPIYEGTNALTGSNLEYKIDGFAAFYITAMLDIPSSADTALTGYPGPIAEAECVAESNNGKGCIFGWFLDDYIDFTGTIKPGGTDYGVTVVQPLG